MPDEYTALARKSFEAFTLLGERIDVPDNLPPEIAQERAACFVSLHVGGDLRGCIGTIEPAWPTLADEIVENAIAACSRDPRFPAVRADELPLIHCSVDVLTAPEDIEGSGELDPKRFGVIVRSGWKRGVLLPDLEGVDSIEDQITIAKRKAGIPDAQDCTLQRFEVVRHEE